MRVGVYFPYTDTDALEAVHIVTLPDAAQGTLKFLQRRVGPRRNVTTNVNAGDRALSYTGTPGIRAKVLYFYPSDSFSSATFTFRVEDKAGNISDATYTATLRLEGTTPAKPSNFAATAGNTRVTLSWDNPNNSTITKYQYQQRLTEGLWGGWTDICVTSGDDTCPAKTSHVITGLTNGTNYEFRIRAENDGGTSPESPIESATPGILPAPWGLTATGGPSR